MERGIDEAMVVGDVIVRVLEINSSNEVRLAVSSPNGRPRYQEIVLRIDGTDGVERPADAAVAVNC
ncbi:MAG: hypothetical protein KF774_02030 [Planctomyces sp.]|nr:hypothetical protein [Planctomyces sp.]